MEAFTIFCFKWFLVLYTVFNFIQLYFLLLLNLQTMTGWKHYHAKKAEAEKLGLTMAVNRICVNGHKQILYLNIRFSTWTSLTFEMGPVMFRNGKPYSTMHLNFRTLIEHCFSFNNWNTVVFDCFKIHQSFQDFAFLHQAGREEVSLVYRQWWIVSDWTVRLTKLWLFCSLQLFWDV